MAITTADQATATYKLVDGHMVHDGYFIYGNGTTLMHVELKHLTKAQA